MVQVPAGYVASEIVAPFVTLLMTVLVSVFMNWTSVTTCALTGSKKMATNSNSNNGNGNGNEKSVFMVPFALASFFSVL
jgi:hypothetical protein